MDPSALMQTAIDKCREGIERGQTPFGCAIAQHNNVISCSHNTVLLSSDITAHAEMNAIREGCRAIGDIFLEGAVVATTCEPCPMCMAALHWARIDTVYYGATIADAMQAGFSELAVSAEDLIERGGSRVKLIGGVMDDECRRLFTEWMARPESRAY